MSEYEASGGTSRAYQLSEAEQLYVEVHPESYSVLWPSVLSDSDLAGQLASFLPQAGRRGVVYSTVAKSLKVYDLPEVDAQRFLIQARSEAGEIGFARIDYDDRVLTWELSEPDSGRPNEIGFLAQTFDPSYLVVLVRETGTSSAAQAAEEVIYGSRDIVARFSEGNLYPDDLGTPGPLVS